MHLQDFHHLSLCLKTKIYIFFIFFYTQLWQHHLLKRGKMFMSLSYFILPTISKVNKSVFLFQKIGFIFLHFLYSRFLFIYFLESYLQAEKGGGGIRTIYVQNCFRKVANFRFIFVPSKVFIISGRRTKAHFSICIKLDL